MAKSGTAKKSKKTSKIRRARKASKLPSRKKKAKVTKKAAKKSKRAKKVTKKTGAKKAIKKAAKRVGTKKLVTNLKIKKAPATETIRTPEVSLHVGDKAPAFAAMDQHGTQVSLADFAGKNVVLYFYPKDDTPGCTREACSFRDHLPSFEGVNAVILGVSFDDQESHQKFISKYDLNFSLLADTNKEIAESYGVYVQKNMYGKTYMGIERSTFLIDAEGKIAAIFRNVKVDGHTEEVLQALKSI
ncbi:MAG: thioredoxin-dependent thiol peroxidase [Deltaproteobacteria bacterium CG11_big_fil_rev_8_21_14_0_20_45_16]|nr:MAG: thioredoxin-dependent thiol peroxidase [Deltaproteobacteria bacterium CG11_big_fil_rev_8_21_14_0_20_45_16]